MIRILMALGGVGMNHVVMSVSLMGHYPFGLWGFTWHCCSTLLQRSPQWVLWEQYKITAYKGVKESSSKFSNCNSLLCDCKKDSRYFVTSPLAGLFQRETRCRPKILSAECLKISLQGVWGLQEQVQLVHTEKWDFSFKCSWWIHYRIIANTFFSFCIAESLTCLVRNFIQKTPESSTGFPIFKKVHDSTSQDVPGLQWVNSESLKWLLLSLL